MTKLDYIGPALAVILVVVSIYSWQMIGPTPRILVWVFIAGMLIGQFGMIWGRRD